MKVERSFCRSQKSPPGGPPGTMRFIQTLIEGSGWQEPGVPGHLLPAMPARMRLRRLSPELHRSRRWLRVLDGWRILRQPGSGRCPRVRDSDRLLPLSRMQRGVEALTRFDRMNYSQLRRNYSL
jgi:hypothetical protein